MPALHVAPEPAFGAIRGARLAARSGAPSVIAPAEQIAGLSDLLWPQKNLTVPSESVTEGHPGKMTDQTSRWVRGARANRYDSSAPWTSTT